MRRHLLLYVAALLLSCGTAGTDGTSLEGAQVPPRWRAVRESKGHVVHLDKKVACNQCHEPGEWKKPKTERCFDCHEEARVNLHADVVKTSTKTPACLDCHGFGEEPKEPWGCKRCHAMPAKIAQTIKVHVDEACDKCHLPHAKQMLRLTQCGTCHEKQQGALHGPMVDPVSCRDCHGGHGEALAANLVCAQCHDNPVPRIDRRTAPAISKKRTIPGHTKCVDCHRPHDVEGGGFKACDHCHDDQPLNHGKGPGRCIDCHHPHDGPTAGTAPIMPRCDTCHPDQARHGKDLTCLNCHKRHEVLIQAQPAFCQRCHQQQRPKGHQDCMICHEEPGHAPKQVDGNCQRCHEEVAGHVVPGHQKCRDCHQDHGELKIKGCADCHEKQAVSKHVLLVREAKGPGSGVRGVCGECHPAHESLKMPTCDSCHEPGERKGLHGSRGHDKCQACHTGHQDPPFDRRATCLACHGEQREHEVKAERCGSCHPFDG